LTIYTLYLKVLLVFLISIALIP